MLAPEVNSESLSSSCSAGSGLSSKTVCAVSVWTARSGLGALKSGNAGPQGQPQFWPCGQYSLHVIKPRESEHRHFIQACIPRSAHALTGLCFLNAACMGRTEFWNFGKLGA